MFVYSLKTKNLGNMRKHNLSWNTRVCERIRLHENRLVHSLTLMRDIRHVNHRVGTYALALEYGWFPPYTHVYLYGAKTGQREKRIPRSSLWLFLTVQSDSKFRRSHAPIHRRLVALSRGSTRPLENQETRVSCTRPLAQETSPVLALRRRYVRTRQQDVVYNSKRGSRTPNLPVYPLSDTDRPAALVMSIHHVYLLQALFNRHLGHDASASLSLTCLLRRNFLHGSSSRGTIP